MYPTVNTQLQISAIHSAFSVQPENSGDIIGGSRDCWMLIYLHSGTATVTSGTRVIECNSHTVVFNKPGEFHYISKLSANAKITVICFSATGNLINNLPSTAVAPQFCRELINNIHMQFIGDHYNSASLSALLEDSIDLERFATMIKLVLLYSINLTQEITLSSDADAGIFAKAAKIMQNNISSNISVTDLSKKLNISISHLKRIFARFCNIGVHEFFMILKINRAKEYLNEGFSVTQTAELTGFNNQNYFSSAFKRIAGVSPKDYAVNKPLVRKKKTAVSQRTSLPDYLL